MLSLLYVSDRELGFRGLKVIKYYFPHAVPIIWDKGNALGRKKAFEKICSQDWDIAISFFNDLIFKPEELAQMKVPINIHPAKPDLPGVAYETIPLIRNDSTFGITLHQMTKDVDRGKIYEVIDAKIKPECHYLDFRREVHQLSLKVLARTLKTLADFNSAELLKLHFALQASQCTYNWSDDYWSNERVINCLDSLWEEDPTHRVFTGHPAYPNHNLLREEFQLQNAVDQQPQDHNHVSQLPRSTD